MLPPVSINQGSNWQVPDFNATFWLGKEHAYCVVIPVVNEGIRIANLLERMSALHIDKLSDIIIVDGGSTDGSLESLALQKTGVRGLLLKNGPGKLGAQLRCAYTPKIANRRNRVASISHLASYFNATYSLLNIPIVSENLERALRPGIETESPLRVGYAWRGLGVYSPVALRLAWPGRQPTLTLRR